MAMESNYPNYLAGLLSGKNPQSSDSIQTYGNVDPRQDSMTFHNPQTIWNASNYLLGNGLSATNPVPPIWSMNPTLLRDVPGPGPLDKSFWR